MFRLFLIASALVLAGCPTEVSPLFDAFDAFEGVGPDANPGDAADGLFGDAVLPDGFGPDGQDGGDGFGPDAQGPLVPTIEAGLEFGRSALWAAPTQWAADLGPEQLLMASESEVWRLDGAGTSAVSLGLIPGAIQDAALVEGVLLLATATTLLVPVEGVLTESPIHAALNEAPIQRMHQPAGAGDTLWFVTGNGLWFWEAGWLIELAPIGLENDVSSSTWGAEIAGERALWLGAPDEIYALYPDPSDPELWAATRERSDLTPAMMTADSTGVLWVLDDGGVAHLRRTNGVWHELDLGGAITHLTGHRDAASTWLLRADGQIIQHLEGRWRSAAWIDAKPRATGDDTLIVHGATTTDRLAPLGFVAITGLPQTPIRVPIRVGVSVDDPQRVDHIEAEIDAQPVPITSAAPFELVLDANALSEGAHELSVVVHYNDGALAVTRIAIFDVGAPLSWATDIQPLWAAECTPCHHPDTSSHPLHTAALWRVEVQKIYTAVDTGYMPLDPRPKLAPSDIALIKAWWDAGLAD